MIPDIPEFGPWSGWIWLAVVVGIPVASWAIRRGLASRTEMEALRRQVAELEARAAQLPDRNELHQLSLITGQLAGRIELIGARGDERHEEFHGSLLALERKIDGMMTELRTPLHLIMQAYLGGAGNSQGGGQS